MLSADAVRRATRRALNSDPYRRLAPEVVQNSPSGKLAALRNRVRAGAFAVAGFGKELVGWCREGDSNPHNPFGSADFKSDSAKPEDEPN
jgi:hypothetical protein